MAEIANFCLKIVQPFFFICFYFKSKDILHAETGNWKLREFSADLALSNWHENASRMVLFNKKIFSVDKGY